MPGARALVPKWKPIADPNKAVMAGSAMLRYSLTWLEPSAALRFRSQQTLGDIHDLLSRPCPASKPLKGRSGGCGKTAFCVEGVPF